MRIVIKLGGTLLENSAALASLTAGIAAAAREHSVVVVHGGGKQVSQYLKDRGIESRWIDGLRVSDAAVIEGVVRLIAGELNTNLVALLVASGCKAVGLTGVDAGQTAARVARPELERVGEGGKTDGRLLDTLTGAGFVPVVACVAADGSGQILNMNADSMAVSCALGWEAEHLLFLTDVDGVRDAAGGTIPTLTAEQVASFIADGVATGGMQAKLQSACMAMEGGIRVFIAAGMTPDIIGRYRKGEAHGTVLVPKSHKSFR